MTVFGLHTEHTKAKHFGKCEPLFWKKYHHEIVFDSSQVFFQINASAGLACQYRVCRLLLGLGHLELEQESATTHSFGRGMPDRRSLHGENQESVELRLQGCQ